MNFKEMYKVANEQPHEGVEGVMSCSKLGSVAECSEYKGESVSGPLAQDGTFIHYCLEHTEIPSDAPDDFRSIYEHCRWRMDELKMDGWVVHSVEKYYTIDTLTGKIDVVMRQGDDWLVIDYKTGRVPVTNDCYQFAGNVVLLMANEDVKGSVHSMIVQPGNESHEPYKWAEGEAQEKLDKAMGNSDISVGDACTYCANRHNCKPRVAHLTESLGLEHSDLTPEGLGKIFTLSKVYAAESDRLKSMVNKLALEGSEVQGARIMQGRVTKKLPTPYSVYENLKDLDCAPDISDFLKGCTIKMSALKKLGVAERDVDVKSVRGPGYLMKVKG